MILDRQTLGLNELQNWKIWQFGIRGLAINVCERNKQEFKTYFFHQLDMMIHKYTCYHTPFQETLNRFELQNEIAEQTEINKTNLLKILQPLILVAFDSMEIEQEEQNIQELIASQTSIINVRTQVDLEQYFQNINIRLKKEYLKNNHLRNCYLDIFEKDSIQRKQCSTTELLINLFKTSYSEFMNKQIDNIGIIKLFIEDNIDAFITGSLIPPQQVWHDYKILILAIIIKIMRSKSISYTIIRPNFFRFYQIQLINFCQFFYLLRLVNIKKLMRNLIINYQFNVLVKSSTGQLIYECMVAQIYAKLGCIFQDEVPYIPEFKDYFEWYFWSDDRNKYLEINELTEDQQRQLRIVSIIRKYSFLLWSLLWIDPNQILSINPDLQQFRQEQKIPAYRYLNKDRQMFAILVFKFVQCNTFAFVPALNALYDVVQDKKILLPIFNMFQDKLSNDGLLESLLDDLGPLKELAKYEFFVYPQVHDKGLIRIVQGKLKLLLDEGSQTENDFYAKLFLNDQRPTFYQD